MKKIALLTVLLLIFLFLLFLVLGLKPEETGNLSGPDKIKKGNSSVCLFEIRDVKIEKNNSEPDKPSFRVMGFLKGNKEDFVNSIFTEVRTDDDKKIFIASSSQNINRSVVASDAVPFTILLYPDTNIATIKDALNSNTALKFNSYPLLDSCSWKDNVSYFNINIEK